MSAAQTGKDPKEVQVTWEDQNKINAFGRLNQRFEEVNDVVQRLRQQLEHLDDAADAVEMTLDDDACKYEGAMLRSVSF